MNTLAHPPFHAPLHASPRGDAARLCDSVIVCTVADSFTPTISGTTGIITWEYCQAAKRLGQCPFVFARNQSAEPYPWPHKALLDWPRVPTGKLGHFLMRAQRKATGWQHFRQGKFVANLAAAIKSRGLQRLPILLMNDIEPALYLRRKFPHATIIHHFQNQQECRPQFRKHIANARLIITAVSSFTARWIERYYDLPAHSVQTIFNGVDCARFFPAPEQHVAKPVVSFIGRTGIEKAPDMVLKAALRVAQRTRNFSVQILGSNHTGRVEIDDYQKILLKLADELRSLGIDVRMPGFLNRKDVPDEIRKGHIHVTPSRWEEPFGMVTLEAMASGLATIASRTGGTPEFVGDAALLYDKDDVSALASHMERFVMQPAVRTEYARRGRQVAQALSWDKVWSQFAGLMEAQRPKG
jgi:glycosyltransferase involved in cell wall biosynthesis